MQAKWTWMVAMIAASAAHAVAAADKIVLKVADVYPPGHPVAESTAKFFMEHVKKATNGEVDFQYFPAEQLGKGKDLLALTQAGVVDIGLVVPSYVSDKMPLSAVAELPGGFAGSCEGTVALAQQARDGALAKYEFQPNGVRVLIAHTFAPFQFVTTRKYEGMKSLEGQKMRSLGAAMDITIRKLKGTPVRIPAPEINESMSRGTIDGGLMGYPTVLSYDLARVVKTATRGENFGGAAITYAIAENRFKALPANVQKALVEAGDAATRNGCAVADRDVAPAAEKLKAAGIQLVEFPPEERKALQSLLTSVSEEWAAELDKRGKPGTMVLKDFRAAVAKQR
ncbi:MAG: TRAP transporter substrate-binding protein DctP [Casimicrobiaceae bacterium]